MIDLIQRLHSAGIGNDATHFWNFCVKVADTLEKQEAEIAKWKATAYENAISLEQEVAELRLFKHNMTLRYNAMNVDLAAYRNSFTALKTQADKAAADAGRLDWIEHTHHDNVIHIGKTWYTRAKYGAPFIKCQSLREACDAAMKESQQ